VPADGVRRLAWKRRKRCYGRRGVDIGRLGTGADTPWWSHLLPPAWSRLTSHWYPAGQPRWTVAARQQQACRGRCRTG